MAVKVRRGADLGLAEPLGRDLGMHAVLEQLGSMGVAQGGADLRGARNLTQTQLDAACGDATTMLPERLELEPCSRDR